MNRSEVWGAFGYDPFSPLDSDDIDAIRQELENGRSDIELNTGCTVVQPEVPNAEQGFPA